MIRLRIGLGMAALALLAGSWGQSARPTPVQKLIREQSKADVSTPEKARQAAFAFERALSKANPQDPFWIKGQYDLAWKFDRLGEQAKAVRAYERVVAAKVEGRFALLRSAAANQAATILNAMKAPVERREAAYRRALALVSPRDPFAPLARMTQRGSLVELLTETPGFPSLAQAFTEWKIYVQEGRQGRFTLNEVQQAHSEMTPDTWKENAQILLRQIAAKAAERRDVASADRAFDLYRREWPGKSMEIAFAAAVAQAKHGPHVPDGEYRRLFEAYQTDCPTRSTILADALEEAFYREDRPAMRFYAEAILKLTPRPDDAEDPAQQFAFARQILKLLDDPRG